MWSMYDKALFCTATVVSRNISDKNIEPGTWLLHSHDLNINENIQLLIKANLQSGYGDFVQGIKFSRTLIKSLVQERRQECARPEILRNVSGRHGRCEVV